MNDPNSQDDGLIEDLLRDVPLTRPSDQLDRRMQMLFQPRRGRLMASAWGFAAGVAATILIMLSWPASSSRRNAPLPARMIEAPSPPAQPVQSIPVLAEPRETIEQVTASLDGMPVQIQRKQTTIDVWQPDSGPTGIRSQIVLPEVITISPVRTN